MNMDHNALTYDIQLNTTDNAVRFVNMINTLEGYFDICIGSYLIDAKSMLGVLSMDPRRIMKLHVIKHHDSIDVLNTKFQPYLAS